MRFQTKTTVAINGGLGNQLFQWFYAHSISKDSTFRIDRLFSPRHIKKLKESNQFQELLLHISDKCTHLKKTNGNPFWILVNKFFHLLNRAWLIYPNEKVFKFFGYFRECPNISVKQSENPPRNLIYSYGFFQQESIVKETLSIVEVELLPFLEDLTNKTRVKFALTDDYTVIHIRRYPTKGYQLTPVQFCNLSDDYFLDWRRNQVINKLVVITKDKNDLGDLILQLSPSLVLDDTETSAWEALAIMYGSTKMLGSNSSLSWWGARLSQLRGSEVWMPSEWSFWGNVDTSKILFDGCNEQLSSWDVSGFE